MRLSIRSKLYVFSAVAMLALAAMGALGLVAGYLADVQLHRLRHDHGLALARLSQGEATMRASPPAWPMLTALASNPPELFAEPTLQAPWQAWQHAVASQNPAAMQQHWATLAHQTRALIDREQSEQDQLRHQLFQLILWGGAALSIGLLAGSLLQLVFPFLTQSIVDIGINTQNLQYLSIILIAQLMLVFSKTLVEFIRGRLLLFISTTVNLSILSDFWIKITKLPLSYFDSRHTGDTLQRLNDHKQIQNFLTGNALTTFFNLFNFLIFSFVLIQYNTQLFFVFFIGSLLYYLWIHIFLSVRRKINYQTFHISAKENNTTLQLIQGMQEIRLNSAEKLKRWEWEDIQARIFKLNLKSLTYSQYQQAGGLIISQGKDIIITFLVASLVIEGKLTFGAMLAIQYIIGQLQGPIDNLVNFIQSYQDAKISMERLNEVHQLDNEEKSEIDYLLHLPSNKSIVFKNVSFSYPGSGNEPVLNNIYLEIPEGKVTAIVGLSGSGKTTLLKLLLKFYDQYIGDITIGDNNYKYISPAFWRKHCGAVLQDGYIFNDSIAKNIAIGE